MRNSTFINAERAEAIINEQNIETGRAFYLTQ
jgi:hypothetical protein